MLGIFMNFMSDHATQMPMGVLQERLAHGRVALLYGGERHGVEQFGLFRLGHRDDGKVVFALGATGHDEVVLGGEERLVIGQRLHEEPFRPGVILPRKFREAPVVQHAR